MKLAFFAYFCFTIIIVIAALVLLFACLNYAIVSFRQDECKENSKPWRKPLSKAQFKRLAVITVIVYLLRILFSFLFVFFVNELPDSFMDANAAFFVILRFLMKSYGIGAFVLCLLCLYTIHHNI